MKKTIQIGEKEVTLSNNVEWLYIYRDEFGKDIVPALIPVLNAGIDLVYGVYRATEGNLANIKDIDPDTLHEAIFSVSGLEMVDMINIIYAMAKAANGAISGHRQWVRQFDEFPVDIIFPAVIELLYKGMISEKNSARLQEAWSGLKPELILTK